jgi:hypothetical protein
MPFRGTAAFSFLLLAVLPGCSNSLGTAETLKTVSVSGTLTYQGQPLESYRVTFTPKKGDRASSGLTDVSGKFTLGTNSVGDGAPPGTYTVVVAYAPPELDDSTTAVPIDDPSKLPKPKVKVPEKYSSLENSGLTQEIPKGGITDLKLDLK